MTLYINRPLLLLVVGLVVTGKVAKICKSANHVQPPILSIGSLTEGVPSSTIAALSLLTRSKKCHYASGSHKLSLLYICVLLIGSSGDCELNPGPDSTNYLCGVCNNQVGWEDRAIVCDTCETWFHIDCQGMNPAMYSLLSKSVNQSMSWECYKCGLPNFSTSLFDTMASMISTNRFDSLSSCDSSDIPLSPLPDDIGSPKATSSPIRPYPNKPKGNKANLQHPLRILIMNCQSVKNKKAELHTVIESSKPDIILGNESWLNPDIANSEIFPEEYEAIRKDREDGHGGVFIAYKRDLLCVATPELNTDCEITWCKLQVIGTKTLYLSSFYRPPNKTQPDYLHQFNESLRRIMTNKSAQIVVGGDFNCWDIDWGNMFVPPGANQCHTQKQLVDIVKEHCLNQVVDIPTRQDLRPPSDK